MSIQLTRSSFREIFKSNDFNNVSLMTLVAFISSHQKRAIRLDKDFKYKAHFKRFASIEFHIFLKRSILAIVDLSNFFFACFLVLSK